MSNKSFLKWLDEYHERTDLNQLDYSIMTTLINRHFTGVPNTIPIFLDNTLEHEQRRTQNFVQPRFDSYHLWQQSHEIFNPFAPLPTNIIPPETPLEKIEIHSNIETINDLITIINENPYNEKAEYNIDLKTLHKIKPELVQLNDMIGLVNLKKSILDQLLYFVQNLCANDFKHTVLLGPPGTGKTEVAKIIGKMYSKIGILKNDVFKKVTRNDLIAGYLGQTAIKTRKVIDECLGGVLFIDEAYSLASAGDLNDSYSKECIDILCEALSDHKSDLMVIIAGYEDELNETFFRVNKGMQSRFVWRFKMEPYSANDMMNIFNKLVTEQSWSLNSDTVNERWFEDKKANFVYFGRDMELLVTYTKIAHSRRIYGKDPSLRKIIISDDMNKGYETFLKNKKEKKDQHYLYGIYV
uniref:AAA+ ATPase domain-containing protein n=1 Tax=viral metagenome TaxID=1070528 RepID=A0A6C0ARD6_9ZZZZ